MYIDLHMHSTTSDGTVAAKDLPAACRAAGITHAVLTDHDTIGGVKSFLAAAKKKKVTAISGVEFSAEWEGELHLLAYGVDVENHDLKNTLLRLAKIRENRVFEMIKKLQHAGYQVTAEEVTHFAQGEVIGRPHIAQALVQKEYARDLNEAFRRFLVAGAVGFVPRESLQKEEIMKLAEKAGGQVVLAHPKLVFAEDYDALLQMLKALGLQGIEAYYPEHSDAECAYFHALAKKYKLFVTQGSDFHGGMRAGTFLGKERRGQAYMEEAIERLFTN
ncbi:MAG: PHP domain-containing protein [Christensenellaceae bacterium]|jgi:predicted metal-dependent phosphoesterase TrpH